MKILQKKNRPSLNGQWMVQNTANIGDNNAKLMLNCLLYICNGKALIHIYIYMEVYNGNSKALLTSAINKTKTITIGIPSSLRSFSPICFKAAISTCMHINVQHDGQVQNLIHGRYT